MIKYLDYIGIQEIFKIVSEQFSKLESDVSAVLSAMLSQLENKADKADVEAKLGDINNILDNILS